MKKEVIFIFMFMLILVSVPLIYATEAQQVEKAYACLEDKINKSKCSSFSIEEKVFLVLATGKCARELTEKNISNMLCWQEQGKAGCSTKLTAQAVLALNEKTDTTKAENWLLEQKTVPLDIEWFLEIESGGATTCDITYSGNTYKISIEENKKIRPSNMGPSLSRAQDDYWLKIAPVLYNKNIDVSCNKPFITTLLFKKKEFPTVHVSKTVNSAGALGRTTETVNSLCFTEGGKCNYLASLWAAFVLDSLGQDIGGFMPYLITMMDDSANQIHLPESFLYFITDKFRTELLAKQDAGLYWSESGNKYYDTALALWPFFYEDVVEKENSRYWLLGNQQKSGCWNEDIRYAVRDTAFLLYSIWNRDNSPPLPPGKCYNDYDCPAISCNERYCEGGKCYYEPFGCEHNDGCCNIGSGCSISNDNDCDNPDICTSDSQCQKNNPEPIPYCSDEGDVYKTVYTYECDSSHCVENVDEELVDRCSNSEYCEAGECVPGGEDKCGWWNLWTCPDGKKCVSGLCVPEGEEPECYIDDDCPTGEICIDEECVPDEEGCEVYGCPEISCKEASCEEGVCFYEFFECADNDYCCNPGCTYEEDNDCDPGPECTSNLQCTKYNSETNPYCLDNDVYKEVSTWTCEYEECVENVDEEKVESCDNTEECYAGECSYKIPEDECSEDYPCPDGEYCDENGICVLDDEVLDCIDEGYFCMSRANCENNEGSILDNYDCIGVFACCDTETPVNTCSDEGGDICKSDEECSIDGRIIKVSDTMFGETCCIDGDCEEEQIISLACVDNHGTCTDSCGKCEEENTIYACDSGICCVEKDKCGGGGKWILIIFLLILISLAVLGIVFRDKLRTQWIKLKDKLGGKKEKKKFEMPLTSHPSPQGRILPRRILPPGQQQSKFPVRRPISSQYPPRTPQSSKKPEEKPKSDLDDVLKKLREMGK